MADSQVLSVPATEIAAAKSLTTSIPLQLNGTQYSATQAHEEADPVQLGQTRTPTATPVVSPRVSFKTPGSSDNSPTTERRQVDHSTSLSSAEFQSFISNVPWQADFWPGAGVNAFTGQVEPSAVSSFDLPKNETKQSSEFFSTIHYESNLMQELSVHAGAGVTMNIGPIGLGVDASASLLSRAKVSATSSSILATYVTTYNSDFDTSSEYKLKPEAAELARKDPTEFRRRHGDYFVAGGQRTSTFTALLVFSCSNLETLKKYATNVTTSVSELFKVVGSVGWTEEAKQAKVDLKVYVEMRGFTGSAPSAGGNWDASKVVDALDWFKTHEVGDYSTARLEHYSAIDPNVPRTIPLSGDVFKDIRKLHILLRSISILSGSCPQTQDVESTKIVTAASEVLEEVDAHQSALATNIELCAKYLKTAETLHDDLSVIHRRYSFWVQVLNKIPEQPGYRINAEKNQQIWSYGFTSYAPDSSIEILSTEHRLLLPQSSSPFKRDGTLSYAAEDRLIVGWKIISVRKDGHNGSWRKLSRSVLLSNSARIIFRSQRFRSAEWVFVTYHVNRRQFNFSTAGIDGASFDDVDDKTTVNPFGSLGGKNKLAGVGV